MLAPILAQHFEEPPERDIVPMHNIAELHMDDAVRVVRM
jgi:hypothetical protein